LKKKKNSRERKNTRTGGDWSYSRNCKRRGEKGSPYAKKNTSKNRTKNIFGEKSLPVEGKEEEGPVTCRRLKVGRRKGGLKRSEKDPVASAIKGRSAMSGFE